MISEVFNEDCMIGMARYPDKHFELAIVDPPYFKGVGEDGFYGKPFTKEGRKKGGYKTITNWDSQIPDRAFIEEIVRVSKNQIIFGINYFPKPSNDRGGRLIWDKKNDYSTFSNCEIASCSLIESVKIFRYQWNGMLQENMKNKEIRIHPTQKPIAIYRFCLQSFASAGDKIIDTHMGSQSSRIAAYDMGFDFYGWEIEKDYFDRGNKRFQLFKSQGKLKFAE